jgi:hypothetical protein
MNSAENEVYPDLLMNYTRTIDESELINFVACIDVSFTASTR